MSKKDYRAALARYSLTQGEAARLLGNNSPESGRRWASRTGAPFHVALILEIMRKYGLEPKDIEKIGAPWRK